MPNEQINLALLLDTPNDEKTGAHARKGFSYQDWWTVRKSFELLSNNLNNDFAIGVEIKEDAILLDSFTNPKKLDFFQIKKKEPNNWTITGLTTAEKKVKAQEKSTLSKLYSRYLDFNTDNTDLYFISNAQLQTETKENGKTKKSLHDDSNFAKHLTDKDREKIEKKLRNELSIDSDAQINFQRLNYVRSDISAHSPDQSVIGAVTEWNDENKFSIKLKNISSTCRLVAAKFQKLGMNTAYARTLDQLKERCLEKNELIRFLNTLSQNFQTPEEYFEKGLNQLRYENYPFPKLELLQEETRIILIDITNRTKIEVQEIFSISNTLYFSNKGKYYDCNSLTEMIHLFSDDIVSSSSNNVFNLSYIKCVALLFFISKGEIYNERYFNIQSIKTN